MLSRLQYISQGDDAQQQLDNVYRALQAGCGWIQLRYKNQPEAEVTKLAEKMKNLCEKYQATFIVNDHPGIALETGADGVHLGLDDMSATAARDLLGPGKIIGGTANTLQHVLQRIEEKCDYVGLGPFRFTTTKQKLSPILGIEGYQSIMNELQKQGKQVPVYAIGGIETSDIAPLIASGLYGVAVSGLITNATDTKEIVTQLNTALYDFVKDRR